MNNIKLRERYQGCLLGLACGDAVGAPLESSQTMQNLLVLQNLKLMQ